MSMWHPTRMMLCGLFLAGIALSSLSSANATDETGALLKQVVENNFAAYSGEDIARVMDTIHSQSPAFDETRRMSLDIFAAYDLSYELLDFAMVGRDNDFAYARAQQKTRKIRGPQFQNNIIDVLFVFREENGVWKFWSQAILRSRFIE